MSNVSFTDRGLEDYIYWQTQDKKTLKRLNALIFDIKRHPFEGLGKPEALKNVYSGFWSRRIDEENRLVYRVTSASVEIIQCRGHYDGK